MHHQSARLSAYKLRRAEPVLSAAKSTEAQHRICPQLRHRSFICQRVPAASLSQIPRRSQHPSKSHWLTPPVIGSAPSKGLSRNSTLADCFNVFMLPSKLYSIVGRE